MEIKEVNEALTGVKTAFEEFKKANDDRLAAVEKGQGSAEFDAKLEKIEQAMEAKEQALESEILALKRSRSVVTDEQGNEINLDAKAQDWANLVAQQKGKSPAEFNAESMAERKAAFEKYAREGKEGLTPDEVKTLSVGSDSDGGYFVNPDMSGRIVQKVFESSPVRAYASVQVISNASLKGLYDDDEATTFWEGESDTVQTGDTPEIGEWEIVARTQRTLLKSTQELL